MKKMTAEEILEFLEERNVSLSDFAYGDFEVNEEDADDENGFITTGSLGEWEEVDQYGGEGQGDKWYSVKYFKDHDVYIRTDGWYSSYHGADFEDYGKAVFPTEKTITVYE